MVKENLLLQKWKSNREIIANKRFIYFKTGVYFGLIENINHINTTFFLTISLTLSEIILSIGKSTNSLKNVNTLMK